MKGRYHENPSIKLECEEVFVTPEEFMNLVRAGKVYGN